MNRLASALSLAFVGLCVLAVPSRAVTYNWDQQYTAPATAAASIVSGGQIGQSFTPTATEMNGAVFWIDVEGGTAGESSTVAVQVRQGAGLYGTLLATSADVTLLKGFGTAAYGGAPVVFTFAADATLVPGQPYTLVLTVSYNTPGDLQTMVFGTSADGYTGGQLHAYSGASIGDLNFREGVTPVSLAVLGDLGRDGTNFAGADPIAGLVQDNDGLFYGATTSLGADEGGAIFEVMPTGGLAPAFAFSSKYKGRDVVGAPSATLIQGTDGSFYGATGTNDSNLPSKGAVFQFKPPNSLVPLYTFQNTDSIAFPIDGLVQGMDGSFYGTTSAGGANNKGAVFRATPDGVLTFLHAFSSPPEGHYPYAGLTSGTNGNFYGTTSSGGTAGQGTIFKITPGGVLTTLYSFSALDSNGHNADGAYPTAALLLCGDGNFYGTAYNGGTDGRGTIFQCTPTGNVIPLHSFTIAEGGSPYARLTQGSDGNFYGTTLGGGGGGGTIFQFTPAGVLTILHGFSDLTVSYYGGNGSNIDGYRPYAEVLQASDGNFYGTAYGGGTYNYGTVFRLNVLALPAAVQFHTAVNSVYETERSAMLRVDRIGGTDAVSVDYATSDGPAIQSSAALAGTDYTSASGTLSWAAGDQLPKFITVPIIDRDINDGTLHTLSVTLSNPVGAISLGFPVVTTLTINDTISVPVIATTGSASAKVGQPFTYQVVASNHPTHYGATGLADGLTIDRTTGLISGTPPARGMLNLTLNASNAAGKASAPLTITITQNPPTITSPGAAVAVVGQPFTYQITASGGNPQSFGAQGLPPGFSLNAGTGVISGTPTAAGQVSLTLRATNSAGSTSALFSLTINQPTPVITSDTTASGTTGSSFAYQITATNNPVRFGVQGLPGDLSVNASTGLISGTYKVAGTLNLTLNAYNATGQHGSAPLTINISQPAPVITSATTANATLGQPFTYQITATNNPAAYGVQNLPVGFSVNTGTGLISGTPRGVATVTLTLNATNSTGTGSASVTLTISKP